VRRRTVTAGELDATGQEHLENASANNVVAAIGAAFAVSVSDANATIDSDTEAFTGARARRDADPGAITTITLTDAGNGDGTTVIDADGDRTTTARRVGRGGQFRCDGQRLPADGQHLRLGPRLCGRGNPSNHRRPQYYR